jgi:CRISPR/Cas system-associated exonuclease Cas4 (RecB family)
MNRQIVQLHTIEQWNSVTPDIQKLVITHIKLKDRLHRYLMERQKKKNERVSPEEPTWVPCNKCETKGWVLREPRYPGVHPSQVAHQCLLRLYKELIGERGFDSADPRTMLIWAFGTSLHDLFQAYGEDGAWGSYYKKEAKITGELQKIAEVLMLEGHADADNILVIEEIPNAPIFEVGIIHEYKSINSYNFSKLTRPKPEHKQQALIYSVALNRPIVVYLYMNKDDSHLADFPVPFDPVAWSTLETKIKTVLEHYDGGTPPPATSGFHCSQCSYVFNCEHAKGRKSVAGR